MNQKVIKPRKQRIRENRKKILKKRVVAAIGATLFTSALVAATHFDEGTASARAFLEKYQVQKGDNLFNLSKRFDSSVEELKSANQLKSDTIFIGQKLIIPSPPSSAFHIVKKGETIYSISKLYQVDIKDLVEEYGLKNNQILVGQKLNIPLPSPNYIHNQVHEAEMGISEYYTVVSGDTLWSISKRFDIPFLILKKENQLITDDVIVGQKLFIPGEKQFASAEIVGAADNHTVEFLVKDYPVPLKVPNDSTSFFQKKVGQKLFISYKNGALISFY